MRTQLLVLTALSLATLAHADAAPDGQYAVATLLPPPVETRLEAAAPAAATVSVPVLKQPVQKGETITADNLTTLEIPAQQAFASTIASADELAGQQAVRPLGAGQPINRLHVRVAPMVARNQSVTFTFKRGGIELSGSGQALEDGQLGQSIRVINPATRSTILGTVTGNAAVAIN